MTPGQPHQKWTLTEEAFDALLTRLDADRDRAGEIYLEVRRKLVRFFEWRGCPSPDDHADETVNRVARRALEGEPIQNPVAYVLGTARLLVLEIHKEQARERQALGELARAPEPLPDDGEDQQQRVTCLRRCLSTLPPESRELILDYYRGEKSAKIKTRKRLTDRLEISIGTLRMRALRLREGLQSCVDECLRA